MKIRNLVKNIFTILGATIVGLILCEIILRVAGISYPVFDTYDELRGIALRPYKEGWYRNEGEAYLQINSLGYRDVEHSIEKPPGTFRIAVLGDSFTEARQVALEDTFWSYLGKNLNTCTTLTGKKIEVLNFGIGGYGTTQELLTLQHHVWQFNPDLVLLAVLTGNDIVNNSKEFMSHGSWRDDLRPFHVFKNGELVLDNSFRNIGWHTLWRRYLLYEGVHYLRILEIINRARRVWKSKPRKKSNVKDANITEVGLTPSVYSPPKTAAWKEAWLITEKLFSLINQDVREHDAIFVLTTLTNGKQVHPDTAVREKFRTKFGDEDLFYPERRIRSIGEKYGFPVITMAERLQQVATQEGIFLHGFNKTRMGVGHWNENGHRLAGEILVKDICAKLKD
jgi:hypothetical protein